MIALSQIQFRYGPVSLVLEAAAALDPLITDETDADRLPYWAVLWESAFGLSRWIAGRGGWIGTPVLELGCGAGLAGLAAAYLGAEVTQTDLFPEAVALARANAERNRISNTAQVAADWRAWPFPRQWPLLLGSDVTYERASHAALMEVLNRALAPGGLAVLSDPGRPMTLDFMSRAERSGWRVGIEEAPPAPGEGTTFIYRMERGGPAGPAPLEARRMAL